MRTCIVVATMIAAAGLSWAVVSARQEQAKVPGPGSGVVTVTGTIDIGNVPAVVANQAGEWKMAVANVPDVRVIQMPAVPLAAPEFVKVKSRYEVTWGTDARETIEIAQLGGGSWVRVQMDNKRQRWINLAAARAVEILP